MTTTRRPVAPAAASRGIASLVEGKARRAPPLGGTSSVGWYQVGTSVLVVGDHRASLLPNAVISAAAVAATGHEDALVGGGRVVVGDAEFEVTRWWDPTIVLAPWRAETLRAGLDRLERRLDHAQASCQLRDALTRADLPCAVASARLLIGSGPGLTPLGDDHLAGALITLSAMSRYAGSSGNEWIAGLWHGIAPYATRTTSFSWALLDHASRGEGVPELASLVRAVAANGAIDEPIRGLLRIGGSSGAGLSHGVYDGASAALAWSRT